MEANEDEEFQVSPILYHMDIRAVIIQQNTIGWRQLFNGRFSSEWSRVQEEYYTRLRRQRNNNDRRTGLKWQTQLILEIWKQWLIVWKLRNEEIHGRDETTRIQLEWRRIDGELRELYACRNQMETNVQALLFQEVHEHIQKPHWVTQNWLAVNGPVFRENIRRTRQKAIEGVRSIRSYFLPVPRR